MAIGHSRYERHDGVEVRTGNRLENRNRNIEPEPSDQCIGKKDDGLISECETLRHDSRTHDHDQ